MRSRRTSSMSRKMRFRRAVMLEAISSNCRFSKSCKHARGEGMVKVGCARLTK